MRRVIFILIASIVGVVVAHGAKVLFPPEKPQPVVVQAVAPPPPVAPVIVKKIQDPEPTKPAVIEPPKAPVTVLLRSKKMVLLSDGRKFVLGQEYAPKKIVTGIYPGFVVFTGGVTESIPQ